MDWEAHLPLKTEQSERRLEICRSCPFYDPKWHKCTECGCWMDAKVRFEWAECPKDKWKENE